MKVFVDNDIIHKLAAFSLFDEMLCALCLTHSDVYVLSTAKYKFMTRKRDKGMKRYGGEETHGRICRIIDSANELDDEPPRALVDRLSRVTEIDPGEAILFAIAAAHPDSLLLTGEKKALRALAASEVSEIITKLTGRIRCLEQIVAQLIDAISFEAIRDAVAKERDIDKTMRTVFSSGTLTAECDAREGLASYIGNLRAETRGLLALD
jgi:hypothetical protein